MPSPITAAFAAAKAENRLAFMPFVAAGDPDCDTTAEVLRTLADAGADLIELGVPFSDPIADGPVIQASYTRALGAGFKLSQFWAMLEELDTEALPPLVGMVSVSIVQRVGFEAFCARAKAAGLAGLIVPDVPGDEAAGLAEAAGAAGLDLVQLISPLTPAERVRKILAACSGFVYCLSVAGTTGERDALPLELTAHLDRLRQQTDLPLAVGFGVSKPEHVQALRGHADGAIVGSALVRRLEALADQPKEAVLKDVSDFTREMVAAGRS
ncbi:tryptophan synthase subunit alpha [Alienimonas californiensis]|uniref:Tryptophan synthase alpha chain n=1 Tax=Alienimonas californiensis TaxID=2527989 RepID=A0A517PC43_9PLAN|nr:tryptophan synthase subunit alpha [Alienimonas californiensis]QDT16929.1 Tryptophan synthase alpha chain [Alienimonas californiensis]